MMLESTDVVRKMSHACVQSKKEMNRVCRKVKTV